MIRQYLYENMFVLQDGIWCTVDKEALSYPEEVRDILFETESQSFWFAHRNRCIAEVIKRYPPKGVIFDVGGGNGFVTKGLSNAGFDVALVEPGMEGAMNAKKRGGFEVICAPFNSMNFHSGRVPAAALFDVLEHIENDSAFLRAIHALMQKDALLYVTVPAYRLLWSDADIFSGHFRRYHVDGLKRTLSSCGYKIIFYTYLFGYLPLPSFLMRAMPYRLGFRRKPLNERMKTELAPGKLASAVLNALGQYEFNRLKRGKRIPFGGSVLLVAQKSDQKEVCP